MSLIPAATRDAWSYSGDFYVEVTGHNRHRRATIPELKAIFDGTDGSKDRPAHWYEAQLVHYGLPPSKTKGTAKMRLFDAVSKGNMAVPPNILKVEADLKKEWTKLEREAKQTLKKASAITPANGSKKRTFESVASQGPVQQAESVTRAPKKMRTTNAAIALPRNNPPVAKKVSSRTTSATAKAPTAAEEVPPVRPKQTARRGVPFSSGRGTSKSRSARPAPDTPAEPDTTAPARTKQTARCSRPYNRVSPGRSTTSATSSTTVVNPRTKQTARRSRPFNRAGQGRATAVRDDDLPQLEATPSYWNSYDDPPPPYPGPMDDGWGGNADEEEPLPPLGLLNGRYHIRNLRCTERPEVADLASDSAIIFSLDGNMLWGSFEIGPLSGILRLKERPWQSSHQPLLFDWRGDDDQGGNHYKTDDGSQLKFLGDGEISGRISLYNDMIAFDGYRISGQETRSEISPASMRRQWEQLGR
ncbi:hypothetical protein VTK26DRAFT_4907 [Humicola hyalothermophila]